MVKFLRKKVLKCLRASKVLDIGLLVPDTLTQVIMEFVKVVEKGILRQENLPQVIAKVVDVVQVLPDTLPTVIMVDMLIGVDIGHKRADTLPIEIG